MSIIPFLSNSGGSNQLVNPDAFIEPVLIMGQSNIDHRNAQADLPIDVPIVSDRVRIFDGNGWRFFNCSGAMECSLQVITGFACDAVYLNRLASYLGRDVYTTKLSVGGTGFVPVFPSESAQYGDWNINSTEYYDLWHRFIKRIKDAKHYTEQILGLEYRPKFLLCNIFETDSRNNTKEGLRTDFRAFVDAVRLLVQNPNLPIVHYEISLDQNQINQWTIDLQNEFQNLDYANGGIDNYHLLPYGTKILQDASHWDSASSIYAGEQLLELTKDWF